MRAVRLILLSALLTACSEHQSAPENDAIPVSEPVILKTTADPAAVENAKRAIKAEPKVRDFLYEPNTAVQWKIAVSDDGTDRLLFAGYFCMLLEEHHARTPGTVVRLVSWERVLQDRMFDSDANLGTMDCDTNTRFGSARS